MPSTADCIHNPASVLLCCLMEALDFPCVLAQHWCLGEEGTNCLQAFLSACAILTELLALHIMKTGREADVGVSV